MRRAVVGTVLAVVVTLSALSVAGAEPDRPDAGHVATRLNRARTQVGLAPLEMRPEVVAVAQRHADEMAGRAGEPFHSDDPSGGLQGWQAVGEIVGRVSADDHDWSDSLSDAFLASAVHREEILDPVYTQLGLAAASSNDSIYVTGVLLRPAPAPVQATTPAHTTITRRAKHLVPQAVAPIPAPEPSTTVPATTSTVAASPPSAPAPISLDAAPTGARRSVNPFVAFVVGVILVAAVAPPSRRESHSSAYSAP